MKTLQTEDAPKAIGPYSQATRAGDLVFGSGQIGLDPNTGEFVQGGVKEQTAQVFQNLRAVLQAAGARLDAVVMVNVYLTSMKDFKDMNDVYAETFGDHKPARATVGVSELPKNALVEISCVASLK